jgi:Protein of unknown function (DUF2478)
MFDSQCDLAAMVYGRADDPDRLLREFADDLTRTGYRPAGLIQHGRKCGMEDGELSGRVLPGGDIVRLTHNLGRHAEGCSLEPSALIEAAGKVAAAIDRGADLVVVNRFGKMEVGGRGLVDEICRAVVADIPVLVAVPEQHFTVWTRFSGGMSVKLRCRRDHLDAWWRAVRVRSDLPASGAASTFCEIAK